MLKFTKKKREIAETETSSSKKTYIWIFINPANLCICYVLKPRQIIFTVLCLQEPPHVIRPTKPIEKFMLKFTKKKREIAETETISSKKNYISGFL
jgi:hypothetical protein